MPALALLLAGALSASSPSPVPASPTPSTELIVRGRLLTIANGYVVFTTGDAVRLADDATIAPQLHLGETIRVRCDVASHRIHSVEVPIGAVAPGEIDASILPRDYVTVSAASMRPATNANTASQARSIAVMIEVEVPDDTPPNDDIYLLTERSNYSPAELKMNRLDAHHWSIKVPLPEGATLHYQFTRGSYATVERDSSGGVATPHAVTAHENIRTNDTVARWADTN